MAPPPILRALARSPSFSIAIAAMLALGTAAFTTTFTIADAAILRKPPFAHADGLVVVNMTRTNPAGVVRRERFSWKRLHLLAERATSFETISNHSTSSLTVSGAGEIDLVQGEFIAPTYFRMLRIAPALGRFFRDDEDDAAGTHPIVIISHDFWTRRLAGDSSAIGRTVHISDAAVTIIGVAPPRFNGLSNRAQFWLPTTMAPPISYGEYLTTNQNFIDVTARLKPGVTVAQARAELDIIGPQIDAEAPSATDVRGDRMSATATLLNDALSDPATRRSVLLLLAAVALLHLLACANAANLLLGRAANRRREAAVRAALGASRARLFSFVVGEGIALALIAGIAGMLLAAWATKLIAFPTDIWGPRNNYGVIGAFDEPSFGWRAAAFGITLTVVTALIVGLVPTIGTLRSDLFTNLRAGARGLSDRSGTLTRPSLRGAVVALESALAVLLLVGGGLMITSFAKMRTTDLGVDPSHVLSFMLRTSESHVLPPAAPAYITRVLGAITAVPGVVSASVDGGAPVSGVARSVAHIEGQPIVPDGESPPVNRHYVGPDHFKTLGIKLVGGRSFTDADVEGRPRVTVVSETAAKRFWPGEDPIGRRVWFGQGTAWPNADSSAEVIGVVGDAMHDPLDQSPNRSEFYTPYAQFTYAWRMYFVKTAGDPAAMAPAIRAALASAAPDVPPTEMMTLGDRIGSSWARHRFDALLFGAFSAVAILLASAGIYAVVAYSVSTRTREMGIRLALGAQPGAIVQLIVREGMALPIVGLIGGVVAAIASTRILSASLYGVTPTNPPVFIASVALLAVVSVVACIVPARRAMRVHPVEALRAE